MHFFFFESAEAERSNMTSKMAAKLENSYLFIIYDL